MKRPGKVRRECNGRGTVVKDFGVNVTVICPICGGRGRI